MLRLLTRENLKLAVVATVCLLLAWTGPAIAHGAHAQFAHNADKVDGKHAVGAGASLNRARGKIVAHNGQGVLPAKFVPKSAKNQVYRYSVPDFAAATFHALELPNLPPGRYLASYSIAAQTSGAMDCGLFNGASYEANGRASSTGAYATVHGTGVIDTRSGPYQFHCFGSNPFTYENAQPNYSQLTFLRMHQVSERSGANPSPRPAAPRAGTGG